eukprot:1158559-Pelagomonas_calceolata.AAC.4
MLCSSILECCPPGPPALRIPSMHTISSQIICLCQGTRIMFHAISWLLLACSGTSISDGFRLCTVLPALMHRWQSAKIISLSPVPRNNIPAIWTHLAALRPSQKTTASNLTNTGRTCRLGHRQTSRQPWYVSTVSPHHQNLVVMPGCILQCTQVDHFGVPSICGQKRQAQAGMDAGGTCYHGKNAERVFLIWAHLTTGCHAL